MLKFIIRRLFQSIPTLFGITILSYGIIVLAPGNPADIMSFGPRTTLAQKKMLARQMGVDEPLYRQYITWLIGNDFEKFPKYDRYGQVVKDDNGKTVMVPGKKKGILRGDFGQSFVAKEPAMKLLIQKAPATIELTGLALLIGILIGIPIGVVAAALRGGTFDNATRVMAVIFSAVPIFWLALTLLLIFGSKLRWLPMGGRYPDSYFLTGKVSLKDQIDHLILPVSVLCTGWIAIFSRFMRASTLDVLSQDYIRTAKAKGLKARQVWFGHAARNALIPIATILGPAIPGILGGALITETMFSWPGIGRTAYTAVLTKDYPVIMASVILVSMTTIVGYLLSDILYAFIDPRIRLS